MTHDWWGLQLADLGEPERYDVLNAKGEVVEGFLPLVAAARLAKRHNDAIRRLMAGELNRVHADATDAPSP